MLTLKQILGAARRLIRRYSHHSHRYTHRKPTEGIPITLERDPIMPWLVSFTQNGERVNLRRDRTYQVVEIEGDKNDS